MAKRSAKQLWHNERRWEVHGSLAGIITRLKQLAAYKSILPNESLLLRDTASTLQSELNVIKTKSRDKQSFNQYKGLK